MANEYIAKDYLGGVASTTLTTAVSGSALSLVVASGTTYPDGTNGPFVVVLDRGTGVEEKVICSSRSGNTLTVLQRGYDGTTGQAHSIGATVEHALDAYSIKQVNTLANTWTTRGDLLYRNASGNPARLGVGAAGTVLKGGTDPAYGTIGNAEVDAAAAIALSKLAAGTSAQVVVANASGVPTYRTLTGDVTISDTGVTTIGNNTVAPANLTTAASAQLIVADSGGVPTYRTVTGDVTISNLGVTAITALSIVDGDVAANTLTRSKLSNAAGELNSAWNSGTISSFTNVTGGAGTYRWLALGDKTIALSINITAGTATAAGVCTAVLGASWNTIATKQAMAASADAAGLAVQAGRMEVSSSTLRFGGAGGAALALGAAIASQWMGIIEIA